MSHLTLFFKENPSHLSYFSVGQMRGSSHLAQTPVAYSFDIKPVSESWEHSKAEKSVKSIFYGTVL